MKKYRVNLSSNFFVRAKCKFCMGSPVNYWDIQGTYNWSNPKKLMDIFRSEQKLTKRFCEDYYLIEHPSDFSHIGTFATYTPLKSYKPTIHRMHEIFPINTMSVLSCDCSRTFWTLHKSHWSYRPDVINRRAKYSY